jgi:hypothetical protein
VIPCENRVRRAETAAAGAADLERPAFKRREGFFPRWKSNPSVNEASRKGAEDLDRPTFLRAQAD